MTANTLGIGGSTPLGWLAFLLYVLACGIILRALCRDVRANAGMWYGIAIFLGLLAVSRQFDLQLLLTGLARREAQVDGWYDSRRSFQKELILGVMVASSVIMLCLLHLARNRGGALRTALVGSSCLFAFVCARLVSYHDMDSFIGLTFLGVTANQILEFAGIAVIAVGGLMVPAPRRKARR